MRTRVFQNVIVHRLFSSGTSYNIFMSYETVTTKTKTKTPQKFVHQKYACSILFTKNRRYVDIRCMG